MELSEAIEVPRVDNVLLRKGPRPSQHGTMVLLGHHLIFSPSNPVVLSSKGAAVTKNGNSTASGSEEFWLLHRAVDRVVAEPIGKDSTKGGLLILKCKNFMIIVFEIANLSDCFSVARSIEKLSNLNCFEHDYPFYYRVPFTVLDDGWTAFDLEAEFAKLTLRAPNSFRISSVNDNFNICPSYPEMVIVPKGIGDDYLGISATFRDGFRFPVLSYYHHPTKSCIMRCGQPLIGPANRRCKEDESILNSLLAPHSRGIIIDTRQKSVATNSKSKGGGCETAHWYSQWRYVICATPRIRELHDALDRMVDLCNDRGVSTDKWLSRLASAGWLSAVTELLTAAANVAQCIQCEGTSEVPVVVHGGEGTDSTLAVCSLAQLILDPDARTIRGFESIIEREWIGGGHPFRVRNSHAAYAEGAITGPQEAPVFLSFLDCVFQLLHQFPCSFEFTDSLLIFLFEHAYASEFGSFLGNNEKEKSEKRVKHLTVSLWSYVNNPEILSNYVNALYEPNEAVIWPSVAPQSIQVWDRLFFRWQRDWTEVDAVREHAMKRKLYEKTLQSKALALKKQIDDLTKECSMLNSTNNCSLATDAPRD